MDAELIIGLFCFPPILIVCIIMFYFQLQSYDLDKFLFKDERILLSHRAGASIPHDLLGQYSGELHLTNRRLIFRPVNMEYYFSLAIISLGWIYTIDLKDIEWIEIKTEVRYDSNFYYFNIKAKKSQNAFSFGGIEVNDWKELIRKYGPHIDLKDE